MRTTIARERLAWMAVVAVLATALAWLASVNLFLLANTSSEAWSKFLVVAGVLIEATGMVLRSVSWVSPIAFTVRLAAAIALAAAIVRRKGPSDDTIGTGAHHA